LVVNDSRQMSTSEKNYHSFELELLAVVESTRHFGYLLLGISFAIITDCNAVQYTMKKEEITPGITRRVSKLQEFEYDIKHRPGQQV